jgi:hypothetical protein
MELCFVPKKICWNNIRPLVSNPGMKSTMLCALSFQTIASIFIIWMMAYAQGKVACHAPRQIL